ncbi:rhodanese-like domain-containing protein [Thermodesulfobacteriota bacterium]
MKFHSHIFVSFLIGLFLFSATLWAGEYRVIEPSELKAMQTKKDFFLLDVHIPEQVHIPGTDAFIDYRKIKENADKLPEDKNTKIVVYCRSGSMSHSAAYDLMKLGYTNVYDLSGGIRAFNATP